MRIARRTNGGSASSSRKLGYYCSDLNILAETFESPKLFWAVFAKSCLLRMVGWQTTTPQIAELYSAAVDSGFSTRPLATSVRSHLRWCFQAQPPVTNPLIIAGKVPRSQMAA
jgi:hypothetical protein